MAPVSDLTDAHILLVAAKYTSESDLNSLLALQRQHRHVLPTTLIYRLLLSFYPANEVEFSSLSEFLNGLQDASHETQQAQRPKYDPAISTLSPQDALERCRALSLQFNHKNPVFESSSDQTNFIINWSHHLDAIGRVQPLLAFVEPFLHHDHILQSWYFSCLVPVVRLQYDLYPDIPDSVGLKDFESLSGVGGVKILLQYAERAHQPAAIARDLDEVVAPWVHGASKWKRRKVTGQSHINAESGWECVNEWFLGASIEDFELIGNAFGAWSGPSGPEDGMEAKDEDQLSARLAQTGLAMIYASPQLSKEAVSVIRIVLKQVANLVNQQPPDPAITEPELVVDDFLGRNLSEVNLLFNSLLLPDNAFTQASKDSIQLALGLVGTAGILLDFDLPVSMTALARVCVFGSEKQQKEELGRLMQRIAANTGPRLDWSLLRRRLLWSRNWTHSDVTAPPGPRLGFLSRVSGDHIDTKFLIAALDARQYSVVVKVYLDNAILPLPKAEVEKQVAAAILRAYDNASDGNRERGDLQHAYEMLKVFLPHLPDSSSLRDIDQLIKATHRLSFYRLNLSHGAAFRPVAIRVQKAPLNLVARVLEQEPRAYTKLDDLLEIGRSLIRAHLPSREAVERSSAPLELRLFHAEHEITRWAIEAALTANDFDTAYSYITTRLSNKPSLEYADDSSWRAAYAAGKYRPAASPKSLENRIENLSQRMELLSRALLLAPVGDSLSEILGTWRRHEEEMAALREEGVQEERASDAKADSGVPGAFGLDDRELDAAESHRIQARRAWPGSTPGISYGEHAPMGLFDVAKGAATSLRKSSFFPLSSNGPQGLKIRDRPVSFPQSTSITEPTTPNSPPGARIRKRDQVTSMVTSGLVSGMGWVLGAQPNDRNDYNDSTRTDNQRD